MSTTNVTVIWERQTLLIAKKRIKSDGLNFMICITGYFTACNVLMPVDKLRHQFKVKKFLKI